MAFTTNKGNVYHLINQIIKKKTLHLPQKKKSLAKKKKKKVLVCEIKLYSMKFEHKYLFRLTLPFWAQFFQYFLIICVSK